MKGKYIMPESFVCLSARAVLDEIGALKQSFELAYDKAKISGDEMDAGRVQEMRMSLDKKIAALNETVWFAEVEHLFDLRKQYDLQKNLLRKANFLESKTIRSEIGGEHIVDFIKGDDMNEYPLPSYRDIVMGMMEKKELLRMKADQGFVKFLLVPFALSVGILADGLKTYLKAYKREEGEEFVLNADVPVINSVNQTGVYSRMLYDFGMMKNGRRGGRTKRQILDEASDQGDWRCGWECALLQKEDTTNTIRKIPRKGRGGKMGVINARADIEAGKSSDEYIQDSVIGNANSNSPFFGESGMTLEDWMVAFMTQLETSGMILDNWSNDSDSVARLTGAHLSDDFTFCSAFWDGPSKRVAILCEADLNQDPTSGARMVVRI